MTTESNVLESNRPAGSPMRRVLQIRNFRLLWLGQGTSLLGDQFYLIALPWLVLRVSADPLVLGTVLALAGVPRALFMLVGGALTDRFSSRTIMLISDLVRLILTGSLALLVFSGSIDLWMLYAFALLFGLVAGFFIPASSAILPSLISAEDLQAGNALVQGTAQLSLFVGPMIAGGLIALFSNSAVDVANSTPGLIGIGVALGVDALTFLVSVVTLWLMGSDHLQRKVGKSGVTDNVLQAIKAGLTYMLSDPMLRLIFVLIAALNCLFLGPSLVGIPVLAATRLPEGAAAFGLIMSAEGGGMLLGIIVAGASRQSKALGYILPATIVGFGLSLIALGYITSTLTAAVILFVVGIGNGYVNVYAITFLQRRAPREMLGRVMSLVMFASAGLVPVSQALSGALIKLNFSGLFLGAGGLMIVVALWASLTPATRLIAAEMTATEAV